MVRVTIDVDDAVERLRSGGLVAVPTETVYGLGADATDVDAVARIFDVKGRPAGHPLIVHLADPDELAEWAPDAPAAAHRLADIAWPGPLTVIVPRPHTIPTAVAGGLNTIGLRVPAHELTREVIRRLGHPVAAPSANPFGAVSPTTAEHVVRDLGDRLDPLCDLVLDGGPCEVGVESTIVDCVSDPPQILRSGAITDEQVTEIVGDLAPASGPSRASGMLTSHYAPECAVALADDRAAGAALLESIDGARLLDRTDDLVAYARHLYADLRRADDDGVSTLIAVLPPAAGLGHAIRDRLRKAAAPRS